MLTRAKHVGVAWQRLRRSAALFLEWFRLCVRHGRLASPRAPKTRRNAVMHFGMSAGSRLKNGRAAIAAGLARHGPPGARAPSGRRTPPHPERARDLPRRPLRALVVLRPSRALRGACSGRPAQRVLRHTAACGVLAAGGGLAEAGQLLRHAGPQVTAVYARSDITALRSIARPWPEEGPR